MRTCNVLFASTNFLLFLMGSVSLATAAPVTAADLTGKTICWANGNKSTYGAGGKFSSTRAGTGTWSLSGSTLVVIGSIRNGTSTIEKMPDGTFQATGGRKGAMTTGSYCN